MFERILQLLLIACGHRKISQPFAAAPAVYDAKSDWEPVTAGPGHYVVCLDCGKQFPYDWQNMRMMR